MIVSLIQEGKHGDEKVYLYDITEGLETIGTVTIRIKDKRDTKIKGLETLIKKEFEK